MTADPYARLDAAYLLGALDADERLAYEAHLAICRRCRAGLAEISAIPSLLAGLDESVFAAPPEVAPTPVPDTLLPRLLQAAGRERARRRWLTTGLGLLAAACAIALIVIVVPSSSGPKPAPRAMAALVATPVDATIALQPRSWGTDLTCWYQRGAAEPSSDRQELVAHGADGATWVAGDSPPARGSSSPAAPHSPRHRSRTSRSPSPTGPRSSLRGALPFPDCGSLVRPAARSLAPAYADLRSRRDETGPVSQGRWLVSLTRWTAANPRPCHWISLMQAEPRYSR
jgi:Putative zinc-finger